MVKYNITIGIQATDENQAMEIAKGLQNAANKVDGNSLVRMLNKLSANPSWIAIAKKFC